jgi:small subunit ribosomal protein S6
MPVTDTVYDLTLLLSTAAEDDARAKILADVEKTIDDAGGAIVGKHPWGTRTLAYEIDHTTDAEYHLIQFNGSTALLEQLGHTLRITDGVVRFRIIKGPQGHPAPPELAPEPEPAAEAVAEPAVEAPAA